jgi:hypothetical protein
MSSSEPKRFDAFLSYNSRDGQAVQEVANRLKREELELYLEAWELPPGREFQPYLARALIDSKTCVVFLGPNGLGSWQKQEIQVAIDKRARDSTFHVIPVLLPGAERPRRGDVAHLEFLINASWVEFLKTLDDARPFQQLVWGITGVRPRVQDERYEKVCPYRGLLAFQFEDAPFFFGREALAGWLVSALRREVRAAQGVRFLGVLGRSGSGKSSVVLAGLLPKLKAGEIEGSENWPAAVLRPGDDPLGNLAAGVVALFLPAGALPEVGQVKKLAEDMRDDAEGRALDLFARMAMRDRPDDVRLLLVVDQFEEVFTNRPQVDQARERFEHDRTRFLANLLNAVAVPGGRVAVVLTMRSDFLGACAVFPQLSAVLSAHQELVGPMTESELRAAIEEPAFRSACEVEPPLTERLLADVEGQSGALPLLQFALTEVWKQRDVRRLTLRAYTELGQDGKGEQRGIEGVLDRRADAIYHNLKPEDQELCRRVFLRLVQPGEGTEDTKRRVSYHELLPHDPVRAEQVRQLVRALADRDARLITTEGDDSAGGAIEVAHEALIRGWTKLRGWIDAERPGLRTQRRLSDAAREWATAQPEHREAYLYSGARLAECCDWAQGHRDELSPTETAFLDTSQEAERQRKQKEIEIERVLRKAAEDANEAERKRADEAETRAREAKQSASRQKTLGRRLIVTVVIALLFAVGAVGLAFVANNRQVAAQKNESDAKEQAKIADSRRLAALSASELENRLDRALLLAVGAIQTRDTAEARNSLDKAINFQRHLRFVIRFDEGAISSTHISQDEKILVVCYDGVRDNGIVLFDIKTGRRLGKCSLTKQEGLPRAIAVQPNGQMLAISCRRDTDDDRGRVFVFDITKNKILADYYLDVGGGDLAFSGNGEILIVSGGAFREKCLVGWEMAKHKRISADFFSFFRLSVNLDGSAITTNYVDNRGNGGRVLVKYKNGDFSQVNVPELETSRFAAFSRDGKLLAFANSKTHGIVIWDIENSKRHAFLPVENSGKTSDSAQIVFSRDNRGVVLADSINTPETGLIMVSNTNNKSSRIDYIVRPPDPYSLHRDTMLAANDDLSRLVARKSPSEIWHSVRMQNIDHEGGFTIPGEPIGDGLLISRSAQFVVYYRTNRSVDGEIHPKLRKSESCLYILALNAAGLVQQTPATPAAIFQTLVGNEWPKDSNSTDCSIAIAKKFVNRNMTYSEWLTYYPERQQYERTFEDLDYPDDLPAANSKD